MIIFLWGDIMSCLFRFVPLCFLLVACNSVYIKPNTMDVSEVFYFDQGGSQIRLGAKEQMEKRGYNVTVGHKKSSVGSTYITPEGEGSVISMSDVGRARYIVYVTESAPKFRPVWCALNGFWWWKFNVSIADNVTGQEIMNWAGRGCANSSLRMLNRILDKLEK